MKRILLLGATGQVGQAVAAEPLPPDWQLGAYGSGQCDITDPGSMQKTLRDFRPDLIINAAAMAHVDQCEKDRDKAEAVNFRGPANLAAHCSALDIPLIHLSTDYVFDGRDGDIPYVPDAKMSPLNVYADTKMMGEIAVRDELAWHVILRTSAVFSAFGDNILTRTLALLAHNDEVKIVTDQRSCPTYAPDLAKALIAIAGEILRGKPTGFGIFHYCGEPDVTRFAFAEAVMAAYAPYTAKRPRLVPALSKDFPGAAERPAYSVLDCAKIHKIYGIAQKSWRNGLSEGVAILHRQGKLAA
jgi:dTDP-4-dehydrorhamnose reductase